MLTNLSSSKIIMIILILIYSNKICNKLIWTIIMNFKIHHNNSNNFLCNNKIMMKYCINQIKNLIRNNNN